MQNFSEMSLYKIQGNLFVGITEAVIALPIISDIAFDAGAQVSQLRRPLT